MTHFFRYDIITIYFRNPVNDSYFLSELIPKLPKHPIFFQKISCLTVTYPPPRPYVCCVIQPPIANHTSGAQ